MLAGKTCRRNRGRAKARPYAALPIANAGDLYVARTYAYVPAGDQESSASVRIP